MSTDQHEVLLREPISNTATVATNGSNHIFRENYKVAVNLRLDCLMVIHGMDKTLGENLCCLKPVSSSARHLPTFRSEIGLSSP